MKRKRNPLLRGLIWTALTTMLLMWGVISLTNGDPLWFVQRFDAQATEITVYWDGSRHTLSPGDAGYDQVMAAFATAIAKPSGYEGGVAFSPESHSAYRDRFRLLEVRFAQPVQVHTRHPYLEASTYLVPLSETHASWRRAFSFPGIVPYSLGPLNMSPENFGALVTAVESAVTLAKAD